MQTRFRVFALFALLLATACIGRMQPTAVSAVGSVGYKQVTRTDSSRNLRPIQISIWYPSPDVRGLQQMTLADYSRAITVEGTSRPVTREVAAAGERELEDYLASLGATRNGAHQALSMTLSAYEDAPRSSSRLPGIVFALGKDESAVIHADLAERIAALGFVVVTVPTVGTRSRATSWAAEDVLTHTADLRFALDAIARDGWTDTARLGAIGYSYGSGAAALLAQRISGMRALVILDGSVTFRDRLPTFREALRGARIAIPVLYQGARNDKRVDLSLLTEIAPQASITLSDSTGHLDFTTLALAASRPGFEGFMRLGDGLRPPGVAYSRISEAALEFIVRHVPDRDAAGLQR